MLKLDFVSTPLVGRTGVVLGTGWIGPGENCRAVIKAGASDGGTLDGMARGLRFGSRGENACADFRRWRAPGGRSRYRMEIGIAGTRPALSCGDQQVHAPGRPPH